MTVQVFSLSLTLCRHLSTTMECKEVNLIWNLFDAFVNMTGWWLASYVYISVIHSSKPLLMDYINTNLTCVGPYCFSYVKHVSLTCTRDRIVSISWFWCTCSLAGLYSILIWHHQRSNSCYIFLAPRYVQRLRVLFKSQSSVTPLHSFTIAPIE